MNKTTWQRVKLGEAPLQIIDGDRGKNYPKQNELFNNGYCLFLSTKNVLNAKFDFTECQFINKEKDEILRKGKLQIDDIVLTTRGTIGNMALYRENIGYKNIRINSGMVILRPDIMKVNSTFLLYAMLNSKKYIDNFVSGSAQPQLPIKDLSNLTIPLPPLKTQRKIAEILSSLDDKIDLLHRQNKTLESLALTLFRHTFIDNPKRNEWEEKPLSEIAEIKIGRTPPRKEKQWFSTDSKNTKWISIKDMEEKIFIFNTSEFLTAEAINKFKIPIIPPKTIILSFKMTLGRVGITTENMLSNEAIAHFNLYDKYEHFTEYLYLFLKTFKYETLGSTSSIVTAINTSLIKNIKIAIPDKTTLNDFKIQAKGFFDKIYNNSKQIQNLESLRDMMLPKLLSGEMEV